MKSVLITGASSGLGKELVHQLVQRDANVIAIARTADQADLPKSVFRLNIDLRDHIAIARAFTTLDEKHLTPEIVINCAGRGLMKPLEKTDAHEIEDVLALNLVGAILVSHEAYRRMLPRKSGHIVNIISTSGKKARAEEAVYCASKWGLRGFTESLRLAAQPHGIRVTGIYPGGMRTNFWKGGEPRDASIFMDPSVVAAEVVHLLETPESIAPSEYVIERGIQI